MNNSTQILVFPTITHLVAICVQGVYCDKVEEVEINLRGDAPYAKIRSEVKRMVCTYNPRRIVDEYGILEYKSKVKNKGDK